MFTSNFVNVMSFLVLFMIVAWMVIPFILIGIRNRLDQIISQNAELIRTRTAGDTNHSN